MHEPDSFTAALRGRLQSDPPKRKGERSRERFKLATAEVLETVGFHAMRVADITDAAASSEGTFYIYFKDKRDATRTVLREFLGGIQELGDARPWQPGSAFEAIQASNLRWIQLVRANAGLLRCALQLADEDAEFRQLVHGYNRRWYERIADSVVRHRGDKVISKNAALFAAYALGAMMDEVMRRLVIYPDQELVGFLRQAAPTDEAIAEALSVIWLRILHPDEPQPPVSGLAAILAAGS